VSASILTEEQRRDLLTLVADADTVELKVSIPASGVRSAGDSLGMDPLDAQIRQVYFFDTPGLTLNEHGVVARASRIQGGRATRSSSCGLSSRTTSLRNCAPLPTSAWRWTRCPGGSCARHR
jgi:hypothetical protein